MRAVIHTRYGGPDVLRLADVPRPVPADDEVLIRIHATTVNRTDCGWRSGSPVIVRYFAGWRRPKRPILGTELAGVVEAVGSGVTKFRPGDEVFGVRAIDFGAHAQYVAMRESAPLALKPGNLTLEQAAAVCDGAILALTCLRGGGIRAGQRLLIYGASGAIGTAAVQLAKTFDARVTAVTDTRHVELVRSLGADRVIDYTKEDLADPGETYDVVFDAVGKTSYWTWRHALVPRGLYVTTDLGPFVQNPLLIVGTALTSRLGGKRVLLPIPTYRQADVLLLKELVESGKFLPVIDRSYPLEQVVEATRYVETQQKTGNVVLTVAHAP